MDSFDGHQYEYEFRLVETESLASSHASNFHFNIRDMAHNIKHSKELKFFKQKLISFIKAIDIDIEIEI